MTGLIVLITYVVGVLAMLCVLDWVLKPPAGESDTLARRSPGGRAE